MILLAKLYTCVVVVLAAFMCGTVVGMSIVFDPEKHK